MTKNTFLKKLREKLSNLDEKKLDVIIKKYEKIIDEEVSLGKAEKDVIASLGNIDLIVKLYTEGETTEKEDNNKKEDNSKKETTNEETKTTTDSVINSILKYIDETFKNINEKLAKRILLILCFVAVGIFGLAFLNIPFQLIDLAGTGIFSLIFDDYYFFKVVSSFWSFSIGICYVVLVIWLIIHYINQIAYRYTDLGIKPIRKNTSKVEDTIKKVEEIKVNTNSPFEIVYLILKIFIILLTIPFIMAEVGLFIALFFVVTLIIGGVALFGPATMLLGMIILIATMLDLIYASISKGGIK